MMGKKPAISYIRYSTLLQGEKGKDSTRRQKQFLTDALLRWNLELDAQFLDAGKSGYAQKHLAVGGAMRKIRDMAVQGQLRGKVLVFEDWDRAGRMQVMDAAPLLLDILNNGCDIVVGKDGEQQYLSRDIVNQNRRLLYDALDEMDRGYRESKRKTGMAKDKWKARREAMANGWDKAVKDAPMGINSTPWWIANEWAMINGKPQATGKFLIKPRMKALILEIFGWYLGGEGSQMIANKLNARKEPLPTRRDGSVRSNANVWHSTMIQALIKNRALLGYYYKTNFKVFPEIISEEVFARANALMKSRIHSSGRRTEHINPWAELCWCANCKAGKLSVHGSRGKGAKDYRYLQCRSSRGGVCSAAGLRYDRFEASFLMVLADIDELTFSKEDDAPSITSEIRNKLDFVDNQIATLKGAFKALKDPTKATSLATMLTDMDIERAQLVKDLDSETLKEKGAAKPSMEHFEYINELVGSIEKKETRLKLHEELKTVIDRITIDTKEKSYTDTLKNTPSKWKVVLNEDGSCALLKNYPW